jgi:hypothetical protein
MSGERDCGGYRLEGGGVDGDADHAAEAVNDTANAVLEPFLRLGVAISPQALPFRNVRMRQRRGVTKVIATGVRRGCHIAMGQARSVGGSGIFRLLRRRCAMCSSPQREARGAFGLR